MMRGSKIVRILMTCAAGCVLMAAVLPDTLAQAGAVHEGERAYARQEFVAAARWFRAPAHEGDPTAETYLGMMYQNGEGVPKDYVEAVHWFTAAAIQNEAGAQFFLALLYDKGFGAKQDVVLAEVWLILAAAQADPKRRYFWEHMRDGVASKLTRDEIAQAQARASNWVLGTLP